MILTRQLLHSRLNNSPRSQPFTTKRERGFSLLLTVMKSHYYFVILANHSKSSLRA